MSESPLFVPEDFEVPLEHTGPGFRMEPLGPLHNERDYAAWTTSIDHIQATPGFEDSDWPHPMTLDENRGDLQRHAADFEARTGFTYSILDGNDIIGCLYIYPASDTATDASVASWVRSDRAEMDGVVWQTVSAWLAGTWPFRNVKYAARD